MRSVKQRLQRVPGLVRTYRHAQLLAAIARERWWSDPRRVNDRSIVLEEWDFQSPVNQARHQSVLAAVATQRAPGAWGDALEIGCAEGLFTTELASRCASVTAYDVSPVAVERTARRLPAVHVRQIDIERAPIPGRFDLVFVMDVLGSIHGRARLGRIAGTLAGALRPGGLLIFTEQRFHIREIEGCWWARWLVEGGLQLLQFFDGRHGLVLVHEELHPSHVIGIYQKR